MFCLDEKSQIQALDRLDPVLPLSPGRLKRHRFENLRHGTLSLYAALDTLSGTVLGKTVRDVIAKGVFTSTSDLSKKLMRYIRR